MAGACMNADGVIASIFGAKQYCPSVLFPLRQHDDDFADDDDGSLSLQLDLPN